MSHVLERSIFQQCLIKISKKSSFNGLFAVLLKLKVVFIPGDSCGLSFAVVLVTLSLYDSP